MFDKKNTNKVAELFFMNPDRSFHLREISRNLGVSVSTVSRAVDELEHEDLVTTEKGVTKEVSANTTEHFRDLKISYNLKSLAKSGLIDTIEETFHPETIVLFGSYSRGEDSSDSDIDIAVVNCPEKEYDLSRFESELERNINLHNIKLEKTGQNFKKTLANGIVLRGYLDL
ncbi:MAG: nucleotidyltransferase domain-containing protein [Candidatus Aenigmatarchaeota archaeon]